MRERTLESLAGLGSRGPPVARGKPDPDPEERGREDGDRDRAVHHGADRMAARVRAHFSHTWGAWYQASRRASHFGRSISRPSTASRAGRRVTESSTATADHDEPADPHASGLDHRGEQQGAEPHHHGEARGDDRGAGRHQRADRGLAPPETVAQLLAEPGHHQQRVVDAHAESDHRGHVEHEDRHRRHAGEEPDDRERHRDGEHADHQRQRRGHQGAEGEHQDAEGERQERALSPLAVLGGGGADIQVEGGPAGHPSAV